MLKKLLIVALVFLGNFLYCEEPNLSFYKETEHFLAFCLAEDSLAAESVLQDLEQHYIKCSHDFHYLPKSSKKIRINLYPDIQTFHSMLKEKALPHWKVCRYSAEDNAISLVNPENPGAANSKETIMKSARYGVGCFFMQEKCSFFPLWLALGFACYEANAYTKDQLRQYLLNNEGKIVMPTFAQIDAQISKKEFDSRTYPMAAYVYMEFLVTNWGWDKALAILGNYVDFEIILQMSKEAFQEKCSQHYQEELKK